MKGNKTPEIKNVNTGGATGGAYKGIEDGANQRRKQGVASPEEAAERIENGNTRGRLGCKMPRINLALRTSDLEYLRIMCRVMGLSYSEFITMLLHDHRAANPDYEQARELAEKMEKINKPRGRKK